MNKSQGEMYSRFSIQTRLSTLEAEERLVRLVGSRGDRSMKPFVGQVEAGAFKFHRLFIGRNSFIPIIAGRIVQGEGGAVLLGVMRLHWAVAVFMAVWMWMFVGVALSTLRDANANSDTPALLSVLVFPLFGIVLMSIGFFPERRKAMRLLEDAFQVRTSSPPSPG